jgi:hypothetical protein
VSNFDSALGYVRYNRCIVPQALFIYVTKN